MTDREQDHLDSRLDKIEAAVEASRKQMGDSIEVIRRGVYGDKENKVEGLIELVPKVKALEDLKKKNSLGRWWNYCYCRNRPLVK